MPNSHIESWQRLVEYQTFAEDALPFLAQAFPKQCEQLLVLSVTAGRYFVTKPLTSKQRYLWRT